MCFGSKRIQVSSPAFFSVIVAYGQSWTNVCQDGTRPSSFTTRGNPNTEYVVPCGLAASVLFWDTHTHFKSSVLSIELRNRSTYEYVVLTHSKAESSTPLFTLALRPPVFVRGPRHHNTPYSHAGPLNQGGPNPLPG